MKSIRSTLTLVVIFTSTSFGQFTPADSVEKIHSRYQEHSIYLKHAMFIFNYKVVQNDLEYRGGKHFKNLPQYMSESPKDQKFAMRAVERREIVDKVSMVGMAISVYALYKGLNDGNRDLAQIGLVGYATIPFVLSLETIRLRNELSRLVYNHNKSLLK